MLHLFSNMLPDGPLQPRDYQNELYEHALKENTIVALSTGAGKTFISVMLLRELHTTGKYSVFLAPTRPLARQQFEYLKAHCQLRISLTCGAETGGASRFQESFWNEIVASSDVLVMTPAFFNDALEHNFLRFADITVLVIDECHRAVSRSSKHSHPYTIMLTRYRFLYLERQKVPRILGLTGSVTNNSLNKVADLRRAINELEDMLCAKVATATNLQATAAHANVQAFVYEQEFPAKAALSLNIEVARFQKLQQQKSALRELIATIQSSFVSPTTGQNCSGSQSDLENANMELRASVGRMLANVSSALDQLGTFACVLMLSRLARTVRAALRTNMDAMKRKTLIHAMVHVRRLLAFVHRELLVAFNFDPFVRSPTTQSGCASKCTQQWRAHYHEWLILFGAPKFLRLLAVLQDEFTLNKPTSATAATSTDDEERVHGESVGRKDTPSCLVFVEQRTYACLVARLLTFVAANFDAASLSPMRVDYVVGHGAFAYNRCLDVTSRMLAHKQMASVGAFRSGAVNTLVCTSVLEEGFDVPRCNLVVEFDFPGEFRRFVQAKGRARARDARFVVLLSRDKESDQKSCLTLYSAIELQLFKECQVHSRDAERTRVSPQFSEAASEQASDNVTDGQDARLTSHNVLTVLERYCAQLPRDSYTPCAPSYKFETQPNAADRGIIRCRLQLPISSSVGVDFVSNWCVNERLAKRDAAFKACQALLDHNELDRKHLTPLGHVAGIIGDTSKDPDVTDDDEADLACLDDLETRKFASGSSLKPGTRSFQRYHPLHRPALLLGACPVANEPCYVYELVFECKSSDAYSSRSFALLSRAQLPEIPQFPLYPESGVRVTLSLRRAPSCTTLSNEDFDLCISFHRVLFESVLNLTLSDRLRFECGDAPVGFLVVALRVATPHQSQPELDVAAMQRLITDAACYRTGWRSAVLVCSSNGRFEFDQDMFTDALVRRGYAKSEHFSKVVYSCRIDRSRSPASAIEGDGITFAQYFERTYHVLVGCLDQPLLDCTNGQLESNLNLLVDRWGVDAASAKRRKLDHASKPIYFIPELCEVHIARASWYRVARFLPAAIYRIENLLKSRELLNSILQRVASSTCDSNQQQSQSQSQSHSCFESGVSLRSLPNDSQESLPVCMCRMMQATTSKSSIDMFDLELLETVGDSFLKWATSVYLFLSFPRSNEGKLTSLRGSYISNLSLLKRGFRKRLPGYLSNRQFEISVGYNQSWLPPLYKPSENSVSSEDVSNEPIANTDTLTSPVGSLAQENLELRKQQDTLKSWLSVLPNSQSIEPNEFAVQLVSDKTVADAAESIIGYVLLALGEDAARKCLQWLQLPASNMIISREFLSKLMSPTDETKQVVDLLTKSGFETRLGYKFNEKLLLAQAFTHASYGLPSLGSYERLEFLGDALLDYLITRELLRQTAGQPITPGQLTDMRSALVNNNTFARMAVKYQYHRMLLHKSSALCADVDRYQSYFKSFIRQDYEADAEDDDDEDAETSNLLADPLTALFFLDPSDSDAQSDCMDGQLGSSSLAAHADSLNDELDYLDEQLFGNGQSLPVKFENVQDAQIGIEVEPPKALGDVFESVAGAIFLDSGGSMETVWRIYGTLMRDEIEYCCKRRPRNAIREIYERLNVRRNDFVLLDIEREADVVNRALPTKRCRLTITWKESAAQTKSTEDESQQPSVKVFYGDGFDPQSARKAAARAALKLFYADEYRHRDFV